MTDDLDAPESLGNLSYHLRKMADNLNCDQIDADRLSQAAAAITTIRAQLAEVMAQNERLWVANERLVKQLDEASADIDRIAVEREKYKSACVMHRDKVQELILDVIPEANARADRAEAALADAREKALREAAEMVSGSAYTSSNAGRRLEPVSPAMAGMDMHHATIADAILAMIDKP